MLVQVPPPPAAPASQQPPPPAPATPEAPPAAGGATPAAAPTVDRVFASDAGLIFSAIKPAAAKDFETVLARLRQALAASTDPIRKQQAAGWKIFKAAEAGPNGSVLYVFVMDPAVKGADYGVAKILAEAYPAEASQLYRLYIGAFASGQTLLNLERR